ncbi:hypothetical protein LSAT2_004374 [Lamellibrachia satsuma]|nr:hypothetical protein LSAT2_004374 [Lamellibrachia satsuma]
MPVSCHPTSLYCTERANVAGADHLPASPTAAAMLHSSGATFSRRSPINERWATLSKDAFQQIVNATLDKMTTLPTATHSSTDRLGLPANGGPAASARADVIPSSPSPARLNSQPLVQSNSPGGALFQEKSGGNDCIQTEIIGSYTAVAEQISSERWRETAGFENAVTGDSRKAGKRYKNASPSDGRHRNTNGHRHGLQVSPVAGRKEGEGGEISRLAVTTAGTTANGEHKYSGKGDSASCVSDDWSRRVTEAPTDITRVGRARLCSFVTAATTAAASVAATAVVGVNEPGRPHTPRPRPILEANDDRGIDSSGCDGGMAAASPQCMKCAPVVADLDEVAAASRRRQDAHQWVRLSKSTLFNLVEELVAATAEERDTRADGCGGGRASPREANTPPTRCDDGRRHRQSPEDKCRETANELCRDLRSSESGGIVTSPAAIGVARLSFVKQEVAGSPPGESAMGRHQSKQCWAAVNKTVVFTVVDQAIQSECHGTINVPAAVTSPRLYVNGVHGAPSVQSFQDDSSVLDLSSKDKMLKLTQERSTNLLSQTDSPLRFNGADSEPWKPHSKRHSTDGKETDGSRRGKKRKRGGVAVRNEDKTAKGDAAEKPSSPPVVFHTPEVESPVVGVSPGSVNANCNRKHVKKPLEVTATTTEAMGGAEAAAFSRRSAMLQQALSSPRAPAPTDSSDGDGDSTLGPSQLACAGSPPDHRTEPRHSRDSPKLGWVAVSKDDVRTIVDTVVSTMMSRCDANVPSFPADGSASDDATCPSPAESSSSGGAMDSPSPNSNIPRARQCGRRTPTDNSRQTGNDLEIGGLAIYSEEEEDKTEPKYAGSPATDSDPDASPRSADTDGGCSPKRGFKWKSNLLMRVREERKSTGSDVGRGEAHGDDQRSKNS